MGTAYEFFVSLHVLHEPERYDLRPSWAAKIRSRIPTAERTFLEETQPFLSFPLGWIHSLPQPKNAITVLYALQQITPANRGRTLLELDKGLGAESEHLLGIAERRRWDKDDLAVLVPLMCTDAVDQSEQALIAYLNWWARPDDFGTMLYAGLQAYYQAFFQQEELRVGPVLLAGLQHARELAEQMTIPELIAELSRGIRFTEDAWQRTDRGPHLLDDAACKTGYDRGRTRSYFSSGHGPSTMSAIPGEPVPDGLLIALKAVADPTRLRILRYLSTQEMTPSELSRRLNLRAPTVTHHLKELRLAGLVNVTVHGQEKLYRARLGALDTIHVDLRAFLEGETTGIRMKE